MPRETVRDRRSTPLDAEAALALVVTAAGDEARARARTSGPRSSSGRAATRSSRSSSRPRPAIEGSADALADSVESLVTSRIDTLPARDRLLLRESAVLGSVVDIELLADALDRDDVRDAARWRRSTTSSSPRTPRLFRFRHAIHRQVAYEGLSYRRRREVHGRAARAIRAARRRDASRQ